MLQFAVMQLSLFQYTFTGKDENGMVVGKEGGSVGNVGVEGGSGENGNGGKGSGGNVVGEGGSGGSGGDGGGEGDSGGSYRDVGGEGGGTEGGGGGVDGSGRNYRGFKKSKSSTSKLLFFYNIIVSTFKTFLLSLSSIYRKKWLLFKKGTCKRGGNCPWGRRKIATTSAALWPEKCQDTTLRPRVPPLSNVPDRRGL